MVVGTRIRLYLVRSGEIRVALTDFVLCEWMGMGGWEGRGRACGEFG